MADPLPPFHFPTFAELWDKPRHVVVAFDAEDTPVKFGTTFDDWGAKCVRAQFEDQGFTVKSRKGVAPSFHSVFALADWVKESSQA
jgi:hypothetical protein